MPHLTRTTQQSIFRTDVAERPKSAPAEAGHAMSIFSARPASPFAVAVDMTPEQMRRTNADNWPRRDAMDVNNHPARKRGCHY